MKHIFLFFVVVVLAGCSSLQGSVLNGGSDGKTAYEIRTELTYLSQEGGFTFSIETLGEGSATEQIITDVELQNAQSENALMRAEMLAFSANIRRELLGKAIQDVSIPGNVGEGEISRLITTAFREEWEGLVRSL